jgi:GNAT superfamily N-acetyltransferase
LAEIWRNQPSQRGLMQPVSAAILEQLVFSKPYFDPAGLVVAEHEGSPVGFAHAGFGANDENTGISTELGTTYLLMLRDSHRDSPLADGLLARSEAYLRERGAKVLYAGGIRPLNAFYLGLYGGSELPGILSGDATFNAVAQRNNYREIDRVAILDRELGGFRAPFSRSARQLRRETMLREEFCPPVTSFWNACTTCAFDHLRFTLEPATGGSPLAEVWFWDVEPLSSAWGVATSGMYDLQVSTARRRQGIASYLLSEVFGRLASRGVVRVEAQTMQANTPAIGLYEKLGFRKVDEGIVYRKE